MSDFEACLNSEQGLASHQTHYRSYRGRSKYRELREIKLLLLEAKQQNVELRSKEFSGIKSVKNF